ncbi:MAG: anhydro-N-acetylmuramic acid kinase [Lachnospiraceae bacterium]|jgi:anhydro-N-acetylmuramic acid kinase
MTLLTDLELKDQKLVIGLMSGTSADGIDAVLVEIEGYGIRTRIQTKAFVTIPYSGAFREYLLKIAKGDFGGSAELSQLNFYLGKLLANACLAVCEKAGITPEKIDFVGSHGHTVFHHPLKEHYFDFPVSSTLQLGEASVICEALGCPVVSDFRVRDVAAGGYGAPLVPYTEYILYAEKDKMVALQNIGGIGNITCLPPNCSLDQVSAFDTGPGNMVMDALCTIITNSQKRYDENGELAARGNVNFELLNFMMNDEYLHKLPPKTTGREMYGEAYVSKILKKSEQLGLSLVDTLATATMFTAKCIQYSVENFFLAIPDRLIVGGGGAYNPILMEMIRQCLPNCEVLRNEDIGLDSGAKEAVAFALLANETIGGMYNNAPSATGASHPVVMGKISF